MPAIVLMPFTFIFSTNFKLSYLSFIMVVLLFFVIYKLNFKLGIKDKNSSLWLSFFFVFSNIFLAQIFLVNTYSFSKIFVIFFLFLALYEFFNQRRYYLIGIFIAMAGMSRVPSYLASTFFALYIVFYDKHGLKLKKLFYLFSPIIVSVLILCLYNLLRFGNILETGYTYQLVGYEFFKNAQKIGLFSLRHIPANLYYFLFKGLEHILINPKTMVLRYPYVHYNPWGLSIVFTSPLFIYLLFHSTLKNKIIKLAFITVFVMAIPIFTWFGIGFSQFGHALTLSLYPFLYLILVTSLINKKVTSNIKLVIILAAFFNIYLLYHSGFFSFVGLY